MLTPFGKISADRRSPFNDPNEAHTAASFGMWLFLISLAAFFVAVLLGYLVMWVQLGDLNRWPADLPQPPVTLLISTLLLGAASCWTLERAAKSARAASASEPRDGSDVVCITNLKATAFLTAGFLVLQLFAGWDWFSSIRSQWMLASESSFAYAGILTLIGLHAVHVIGGAVALGIYGSSVVKHGVTARNASGLRFTAMYWHFLGAVWLLMFAVIWSTITMGIAGG